MLENYRRSYNEKWLKEFCGERLSEKHGEYIKSLVKRAEELDCNGEIFGVRGHKYILNPVVSMDEVREFENKYGIKLPEEYVFFLTKVGNGGAGPYYGLYSLEKLSSYLQYDNAICNKEIINNELTKESWKSLFDECDDYDDDEYEDITDKISGGLLVIGTQGCTYDNLLMLSGSEAGKIVYIDWNLDPDYGPVLIDMTFLEWYENFFREIIRGNNLTAYGYSRLGSESKLVSDYNKALEDNKRNILMSFYRFYSVNSDTLEFLKCRDSQFMDQIRLDLLFKFDENAGIEMFDSFIKGENLEAAISCARRIPKNLKDNYYSEMIKLLYNKELGNKDKVIFYLKDCRSLLAKDLVDFAKDKSITDERRKTAIWAMGKASDKMDYLDDFISFMKNDSYWIAHTALQAMCREKDEKLVEAYKEVFIKYRKDSLMRSNLKIAFASNGIDMKGIHKRI